MDKKPHIIPRTSAEAFAEGLRKSLNGLCACCGNNVTDSRFLLCGYCEELLYLDQSDFLKVIKFGFCSKQFGNFAELEKARPKTMCLLCGGGKPDNRFLVCRNCERRRERRKGRMAGENPFAAKLHLHGDAAVVAKSNGVVPSAVKRKWKYKLKQLCPDITEMEMNQFLNEADQTPIPDGVRSSSAYMRLCADLCSKRGWRSKAYKNRWSPAERMTPLIDDGQ